MTTGVLDFLATLAQEQVRAGAHVEVAYTARAETLPHSELATRFPAGTLVRIAPPSGTLATARALRSFLRDQAHSGVDVVHLHSSVAGAIGRLALIGARRQTTVTYSPHGFAFQRANQTRVTRIATLLAEFVLARFGDGVLVTSPSEVELAKKRLLTSSVFELRTGLPKSAFLLERLTPNSSPRRPRVVMAGRISYQKAPWTFGTIANQLGAEAEFVWLGDGPAEDRQRWFSDAPIEVTGWLSYEETIRRLDDSDVFLFPTLWEGMSLSLMLAQARGIPAVVTDVVGNRDGVLDGETGYVCRTTDELAAATRRLIRDSDTRISMGAAARRRAEKMFQGEHLAADSFDAYARSRHSTSPPSS